MPMKYVEPEEYMVHKGIVVYHTYNDENINDKMEYWFSTDKDEDNTAYQFDVRDLAKRLNKTDDVDNVEGRDQIIRESLDMSYINIPVWQEVRKLERLVSGCKDSKGLIRDLVKSACETIAIEVNYKPVPCQIKFLIGQLGYYHVEELIRAELKHASET